MTPTTYTNAMISGHIANRLASARARNKRVQLSISWSMRRLEPIQCLIEAHLVVAWHMAQKDTLLNTYVYSGDSYVNCKAYTYLKKYVHSSTFRRGSPGLRFLYGHTLLDCRVLIGDGGLCSLDVCTADCMAVLTASPSSLPHFSAATCWYQCEEPR